MPRFRLGPLRERYLQPQRSTYQSAEICGDGYDKANASNRGTHGAYCPPNARLLTPTTETRNPPDLIRLADAMRDSDSTTEDPPPLLPSTAIVIDNAEADRIEFCLVTEGAYALICQWSQSPPDIVAVRRLSPHVQSFYASEVPRLTVATYFRSHLLEAAMQHLSPHTASLVVLYGLVLSSRYVGYTGATPCAGNGHRLLLLGLMVATKMLEDDCPTNRWWALFGGVSLSEINELEVYFLEGLNFSVAVNADEIREARSKLVAAHKKFEEEFQVDVVPTDKDSAAKPAEPVSVPLPRLVELR